MKEYNRVRLKSIQAIDVIKCGISGSKYNSLKSKVNKKWTRYLKNNRLFDDYMVYLANYGAAGVEPKTYKELSNVCYNLNKIELVVGDYVSRKVLRVNWVEEFKKFAFKSIKWYDIKNLLLYVINRGYL